jgi:hypothetical protein
MTTGFSFLRAATLLAGSTGAAVAQVTFPLDARACFYRLVSDTAAAPLVVDLAAIGAQPGEWLLLQSVGGFSFGTTPDGMRAMAGVFSSNNTVLASTLQHRVPGALAAGMAFDSGVTFFGGLSTDIPEDFYISRNQYADSIRVEVPAGAAYLLVSTRDSLYGDNVDPNNDWGITITEIPTPALPGTGENLELRTGVAAAAATYAPDVKAAPAGATMTAELRDPLGFCENQLFVLLGDTMTTGGPVPSLLPRLWVDDLIVLRVGVVPASPTWVDTWSLVAPSGLLGVTLIVQGGALHPTARNGLFETSNAHRFDLQ